MKIAPLKEKKRKQLNNEKRKKMSTVIVQKKGTQYFETNINTQRQHKISYHVQRQ